MKTCRYIPSPLPGAKSLLAQEGFCAVGAPATPVGAKWAKGWCAVGTVEWAINAESVEGSQLAQRGVGIWHAKPLCNSATTSRDTTGILIGPSSGALPKAI